MENTQKAKALKERRRRHESFGRAARKATRIAVEAAQNGWTTDLSIARPSSSGERTVTLNLRQPEEAGDLVIRGVWGDTPRPGHLDPKTVGVVRFRGAYVSHGGKSVGPVLMSKLEALLDGEDPDALLAEDHAAQASRITEEVAG